MNQLTRCALATLAALAVLLTSAASCGAPYVSPCASLPAPTAQELEVAQGGVEIELQGVPVEQDREAFVAEACEAAAEAARKNGGKEDKLREAVRLAVRRCAADWTGKKPVVTVLIVRI